MRNTLLAILLVIALVGVVFYMNQTGLDSRDEKPEVGFYAPDFTLMNEENEKVTLSELKGKPVFINIWASWCPPCKEEMPYIQKAFELYGDEVMFLGINVTAGDSKEKAIEFMKSNGYHMPILFDYDASVSKLYRANSIPTSYFIDKDGVIKNKHIGAMNLSQVESYLHQIMEDK